MHVARMIKSKVFNTQKEALEFVEGLHVGEFIDLKINRYEYIVLYA